jgi:hypothetical protein
VNGTVGSGIAMLDNILVTNGGWTKAFTGTNQAAYQMPDAPGYFLYVNDNAPGAGGAREMEIRGYETMASISSGTNPFPLFTQVSAANGVWRKSDTLDTTSREYRASVDGSYVTLLIKFGTSGASFDVYRFGKVAGFDPTDTFNVLCATRAAANSGSGGNAHHYGGVGHLASNISAPIRAAFARSPDGAILSPTAIVQRRVGNGTLGQAPSSAFQYPGRQGFLFAVPILAGDLGGTSTSITTNSSVRGMLPFEFEPIIGDTIMQLADGDVMTSTSYGAGSSFFFRDGGSSGRCLIQTAGVWKSGF